MDGIDKELYFFYEWLILNENVDEKIFSCLSDEEIKAYYEKYIDWKFKRIHDEEKKRTNWRKENI